MGSLFTTIRPYNPAKGRYYVLNEGTKFDVKVNGIKAFEATLIQAFKGQSKHLGSTLLKYDTDNNDEWMNIISNYDDVLVLLFRKEDEKHETHTEESAERG